MAPWRPSDSKMASQEVLDRDLRQVAGDEGPVVLPQPVGDLGDGGLRDEQLARGVSEGVLGVASRQSSGAHLSGEVVQDVGVAVERAHQAGTVGLPGGTHLGDAHLDRTLGRADAAWLIPVAQAALERSSLVATASFEEVGLLGLESSG